MPVVLFEQQHAHAKDAACGQHVAQAGRNGAQVFPQDHGAMAPGLQAQQAQHVVEWEVQIDAMFRIGAGGHHPEALESEHMVDPHASRMGQVGAQHLDVGTKSVLLQPPG